MVLLDVLDLPQIYTKPSGKTILETLALFASSQPSWERTTEEAPTNTSPSRASVQINNEGATRYLTSIVSSSLQWIKDDELKEQIWDLASVRLSERSGRTAMGDIVRQFRIPTSTGSFELSIHEPALTGDDLGHKTWAASYLLAKRLHGLDILPIERSDSAMALELGSGTGLVGLALAGLGVDVILTDLPSICSNLTRNINDNVSIFKANGGSAQAGVLDWTIPEVCILDTNTTSSHDLDPKTKFPLILAADSLYSSEHPRMLVDAIEVWLSRQDHAKVLVEFPYRVAYLPEIEDFRRRMTSIGLCILQEGEEQGYDDWGWSGSTEDQDERALVTCWWSLWAREKQTS